MDDKKILFYDLDGTLLKTDKTISDEDIRALRKWKEAGNILAITTGRSVQGTEMICKGYGLLEKGDYLITFQGSLIMEADTKKVIAADSLPPADVMLVLNALTDAGIYAHTFDLDKIYIPYECDDFFKYNSIAHEDYEIIDDISVLEGKVLPKVICIAYDDPKRLYDFQESFRDKEPGRFNSFFSQPMFLEYCKEGINKGTGLKRLAKHLGIPKERTIAVGDERNDIYMMKAAGTGCCIGSGHPDAKAAADYVTKRSNDESAVSEIIERFL